MDLKEKISLETFGNKQFRIKLVEPDNNQEAILSHYLYNSKKTAKNYKVGAVEFTKEILETKYPDVEVTQQVAEESLQYGIFSFFWHSLIRVFRYNLSVTYI